MVKHHVEPLHRRDHADGRQDGRKPRPHKRPWRVGCIFSWMLNFRRLIVQWEHHVTQFAGFLTLAPTITLSQRL
jgi:hypothetical protein